MTAADFQAEITTEEAERLNAIEDRAARLEAAGFRQTTVADFLGLTPEEAEMVELRRSLTRALRERRQAMGMTQAALAEKLGSGQARVAKVESGHRSVSLDLMVRALLAVGATRADIARALNS